MANHLFGTYTNSVLPHRHHIYATSYDMAMARMCAYSQYHHTLPHWKCVLRCCAIFPRIYLQSEESDRHHSTTLPTIRFHVYHLIFMLYSLGDTHSTKRGKLIVFTRSGFCATCRTIHLENSLFRCSHLYAFFFNH